MSPVLKKSERAHRFFSDNPGFVPDEVLEDPSVSFRGLTGALSRSGINATLTLYDMFNEEDDRTNSNPFFNVSSHIRDTKYAQFASSFRYVDNGAELESMKAKIDQELLDLETIDSAGAMGIVGGLAFGAMDPIFFLLPSFGAVNAAHKAGSSFNMLRAVIAGGAGGGFGNLLAEGVAMQHIETRTPQDAAFAVGAGVVLGGILGGAARGLSAKRFGALARQMERDFDIKPGPVAGGVESVDDMFTIRPDHIDNPEGLAHELAPSFGIAKVSAWLGMSPQLRVSVNSKSNAARRIVQELTDTPFLYAENFIGQTMGSSIESRILGYSTRALGVTTEATDIHYAAYRDRVSGKAVVERGAFRARAANVRHAFNDLRTLGPNPDPKTRGTGRHLTFNEFEEAAGRSARLDQKHSIPEVAALAQVHRDTIYEPIRQRLIKQGVFSADEVGTETSLSYLTRVYVRDMLIRDPGDEIENLFIRFVMSENAKARRVDPTATSGGARNVRSAIADIEAEMSAVQRSMAESGNAAEFRSVMDELRSVERELRSASPKSGGELRQSLEARANALRQVAKNTKSGGAALRAARENAARRMSAAGRQIQTGATLRMPEITVEDARLAAREIKDKLIGMHPGRISYEPVEFTVGRSTMARRLTFDDQELVRLGALEDNINVISRHYVNTMVADLELRERYGVTNFDDPIKFRQDGSIARFGDPDFDDVVPSKSLSQLVVDDYNARKAGASPRDRRRLNDQEIADIRDMKAMWDRLRGTYGQGSGTTPDMLLGKVARQARAINYIRLGGSFAVNSIPDLGRLVMQSGFLRLNRTLIRGLAADMEGVHLSIQEQKLAGAAFEMALDTRGRGMVDLFDEFAPRTRFERGTEAVTRNYGLVTGLAPWNTLVKHGSGLMLHQRILEVADLIARGQKVSAIDLADLAVLRIDKKMAVRIAKQINLHGDKRHTLWRSNTEAWAKGADGDALARDEFRRALRKGMDETIVTPGVGDRPLLMSSEWGKTIGQFKSFQFAVINRALIPSAQRLRRGDWKQVSGLMTTFGLGALVYYLRTPKDKVSDDPGVWVKNAIDRSGMLGFYGDINGIMGKMTGGHVGLFPKAVYGGPVMSRYASRNIADALAGPSAGLLSDVATVSRAGFQNTFDDVSLTQGDTRAARRLLPYQNLFYLSRVFDALEDGLNEQAGLPPRYRR